MANGNPVIQGAPNSYTLPTELSQTNPAAPEALRATSPTNGVVAISKTNAGVWGQTEASAPQFDGSATAASGVATRKLNDSTRYRWTESTSWAW